MQGKGYATTKHQHLYESITSHPSIAEKLSYYPVDCHQAMLTCPAQVQHARDGSTQWKLQPAGFGKRLSLLVESKQELRAGAPLTMDFGPDKTDAQLLLDYGVLDADNPQVSSPSM